MILSIELVAGVSLLYIALLFMVAYYADKKREAGRSVIANPLVYTLSIAVYHTSWTFYGSVGKAATTGLDFLLIYLGPTLVAFSWWFLLRKIVRIAKENNITSIADFISSRYGKSQWLGAIITIIALLGIMPYIALQLKAVSTTFDILCGYPYMQLPLLHSNFPLSLHTNFFAALILGVFGVIFGARRLVSSERHEGLVAAVAVESVVKLIAFLAVGIYVTYGLFDGFGDIFARISSQGMLLDHLTTLGEQGETSYARWFSTLYLAMGAIILLPRQFHVMVIENSNEEHIKKAMWLLPAYMFLINLFVLPVALGGILQTGGILGADFFVLTLPLKNGHSWLTLLAFLGGFSAAAGMVMVESVAISTMILNHLLMPIIVSLNPRPWFPKLLINLKRLSIFVVVLLGFLYQTVVGETFMLVNMGLISFAAAAQFGPALIGGLYWRRGNKAGALAGIVLGFLFWAYTLLLPSFIMSGWLPKAILDDGPFGIALLKPTALFGLVGFDIWTHAVFWSLLFNVGAYLGCSILLGQSDRERDQMKKFVDVFKAKANGVPWETKRMSKPVTIMQFVNLMAKFIGEPQAHTAIAEYLGNREINEHGGVSEFELPKLKRFTEKTLAGSVGAAAAGAIVESYLSDLGSRMEPVYDIFSTVQASLAESREALYVRLRASEIMNRTLDLQIIMDDLLNLVLKEFKLDLAVIRLIDENGMLRVRSFSGKGIAGITGRDWEPESETYIGDAFLANRVQFVNDTQYITKPVSRELMQREGIKSFAHIPIARKGEQPLGIMSVFSKGIVGLFNEPFLNLLESLAGQLAQAVKIVKEMEAKEQERAQKERALLEHARVVNEMEIAKQIQLSLLPSSPPTLPGIAIAGRCKPATHVGGDYYDFFLHGEHGIDMVIADVSGHSVGAALIMAETRSVLRAQASSDKNVDAILATLNELLHDDLTAAELFITMFYVRFNVENRTLSYANAGHNPPLIHRNGTPACTELDAEGLILGVKREVDFEHRTVTLLEGDIVLLYTDGITEAQNREGDFFGTGRLCDILAVNRQRPVDEIVDTVQREVEAFCGGASLNDDVSMVAFKILPLRTVNESMSEGTANGVR
ncbi:sodium:solute symporter family transporter [Geobacter pickeringii]|uniref:Stage II sporulation protein E n=1 Tax=Geobacter pickeringii TaxID=345632 RepID=A0A0B5BGX4_9BACT|nr:SpoIIE family protein phosphatase [Geobacter pickeringii]AJE03760.1 stage II sporulation protein E [Geobacter pickeringii]